MPSATLASLPPEVLAQIASRLISATLAPPAALLCTCRALHDALAPAANPVLYAGVFEDSFDVGAIRRRIGGGALSPRGGDDGCRADAGAGEADVDAAADETSVTGAAPAPPDGQASSTAGKGKGRAAPAQLDGAAPGLALVDVVDEMRRRARTLARVGGMVRAGLVAGVGEADLWVIYLMLIENDGKNAAHFVPGSALDLGSFLRLYRAQVSVPDALAPGYPASHAPRALVAWIDWLWVVLGPAARARARRDAGAAPPDRAATAAGQAGAADTAALPASPVSPASPSTPSTTGGPEDADELAFVLRPFVFACHEYGAFYAPWTRARLPDPGAGSERGAPGSSAVDLWGRTASLAWPVLSHAAMLRFLRRAPRDADDDAGSDADGNGAGGGAWDDVGDAEDAQGAAADPRPADGSAAFDTDFRRLVWCADPRASPGLAARDWVGKFAGCWEGEFSYFEFDAYRDMLDGRARALYEGPFGRQRQVWRVAETCVRPVAGARRAAVPCPWTGPAVRAGFAELPTLSAAYPAASAGAGADARAVDDLARRQIDATDGWEAVPPAELAAEIAADNVELLVTGTGHSAWGRFVMRGRVRLWDGMVVLVKEYAPDERGRWVYRGYLTAGNVLVGRWRDSLTPEAYIGYEGTFTLTRR